MGAQWGRSSATRGRPRRSADPRNLDGLRSADPRNCSCLRLGQARSTTACEMAAAWSRPCWRAPRAGATGAKPQRPGAAGRAADADTSVLARATPHPPSCSPAHDAGSGDLPAPRDGPLGTDCGAADRPSASSTKANKLSVGRASTPARTVASSSETVTSNLVASPIRRSSAARPTANTPVCSAGDQDPQVLR